jgi:hypothetical protein
MSSWSSFLFVDAMYHNEGLNRYIKKIHFEKQNRIECGIMDGFSIFFKLTIHSFIYKFIILEKIHWSFYFTIISKHPLIQLTGDSELIIFRVHVFECIMDGFAVSWTVSIKAIMDNVH